MAIQTAKATQASWWLVGRNTTRPALAVDLLDVKANLVGETFTQSLSSADLSAAERHAVAYAKEGGVSAAAVHFDSDSTDCFAND